MRTVSHFLNANDLRSRNVILPSNGNILTIKNVNLRRMHTHSITKGLSITKYQLVTNLHDSRHVMLNLNVIHQQPLHNSRHSVLNNVADKMNRDMPLRQQHKVPHHKNGHLNAHMVRRTIQRNLRRLANVVQRDYNISDQLNQLK